MGKTPVFVRFIYRNINLEYKGIGQTLTAITMTNTNKMKLVKYKVSQLVFKRIT